MGCTSGGTVFILNTVTLGRENGWGDIMGADRDIELQHRFY